MSKVKIKIKLSEEAYELAYYLANVYKTSVDEIVEMVLTDFWLKHLSINIVPSDSNPEDEIRVIVVSDK